MNTLVTIVAATVAITIGIIVFWIIVSVSCMSDTDREKYGHGPKGQGR